MILTKKKLEYYRKVCGDKYRDRLKWFGKERGEVCFGCRSIFECGGLMGINICATLDHMVADGTIKITHNHPSGMDWAARMKN